MKNTIAALMVPAGLFGSVIGFINDILIVDAFASLWVLSFVAGLAVVSLCVLILNERVLRIQALVMPSRSTCGFLVLSTLFVGVFYLYSSHFREQGGALAPKIEITASFQEQLLAQNEELLDTQKEILEEVSEGKKETSLNPRKELANLSIAYTPQALAEELRKNDAYAVNLFIEAGADPDFVATALFETDVVLVSFQKAMRGHTDGAAFAALANSGHDLSYLEYSAELLNGADRELAFELNSMKFTSYKGDRLCFVKSPVDGAGARIFDWCKDVERAPVVSLLKSFEALGLQHKCWLGKEAYSGKHRDLRYDRLSDERRRQNFKDIGLLKETTDGVFYSKTAICASLGVDSLEGL